MRPFDFYKNTNTIISTSYSFNSMYAGDTMNTSPETYTPHKKPL